MAESNLVKAFRAVAIATASTTTFVKVIKLKPLTVSPDDLFDRRFKEVGVISDAQITAFRSMLIHTLPDDLMKDLRKMDLSPDIVIGLVVDHIESLLQARPQTE